MENGGPTWSGKVNRKQLRDCAQLLGKLVPAIIALMLDHPETDWGRPVTRWWAPAE